MKVWDFPKCRNANAIADVIETFCAETRRTLRERFDCYAIIRYPLSTMASLNSMTCLNVGKGHAPNASS